MRAILITSGLSTPRKERKQTNKVKEMNLSVAAKSLVPAEWILGLINCRPEISDFDNAAVSSYLLKLSQ